MFGEVGVGESKQKKFLSLPGGLAIWRGETTQLKGSRLKQLSKE